MIVTESECVQCGLPCLHNACPYYRVTRLYCDNCKDESESLWYFDGEQLCKDCILNQLEKVEEDDINDFE